MVHPDADPQIATAKAYVCFFSMAASVVSVGLHVFYMISDLFWLHQHASTVPPITKMDKF